MTARQLRNCGVLKCAKCGRLTPRRGPSQKYCPECSEERDAERKKLWLRDSPRDRSLDAATVARRKARRADAGLAVNAASARGLDWLADDGMVWCVRVAVPFSSACSKNHLWAMCDRGHVALREESRKVRRLLSESLSLAIREAGARPVQNRVWLDMLVQKPSHKSDAVNLIDLVCDAAKQAVGVDDRWFCVRRLDWEIVKAGPRLIVGVGQDSTEAVSICACCGRILPLAAFSKNRSRPLGVGRECRGCVRGLRS